MAVRSKETQFVPLGEAVEKFASRTLKHQLRNAVAADEPGYSEIDMSGDFATRLSTGLSHMTSKLDHLASRTEPYWAMQRELLRRLSAEELEARGVQVSPKLGNEPEMIPSFVFRNAPKVNWTRCSVANVGRKYEVVEVRIRPMDAQVPSDTASKTSAGAVDALRPPGRPSAKPLIDEAVASIRAEQTGFCALPRKAAVDLVRKYLIGHHSEMFADDRGLGQTTIEKRIAMACFNRSK